MLTILLFAAAFNSVFIHLIILLVVIAIVWTIIVLLPITPMLKNIFKIILLAALLIWVLGYSGWI